ncbi:hypothetical protein AFLA70_813g000101 [Aspergillus flavus AF70]|nr:hypothetical protein AFLA70_813g000101 [Aspergillus flavus AF70]
MTRGNKEQSKVIYKGRTQDFVIMVENTATAIQSSRATIETEFGTSDDNEAILRILDRGEIQENVNTERQGIRNESQGTRGIY